MSTKPDLILDTNVVVDCFSPADLLKALSIAGAGGANPFTDPEVLYRIRRYRSANALATWLSWKKYSTESPPDEVIRILTQRSPPEATTDFVSVHTYYWVHYVRDFLLRRWRFGVRLGIDAGLKGTRVDDLLLKMAAEHQVPLITNEGVAKDGAITPGKLHARAQEAGIPVFTPEAFLVAQGTSVDAETKCFYRLFCSRRNQDRFKRRFGRRRGNMIRLTLRKLERDIGAALGY